MSKKLITADDWYGIYNLLECTQECTVDMLPQILLKKIKDLIPFSHSHCFSVFNNASEERESFRYYSPDIPKEHMVSYVEKYMDIDFINWYNRSVDTLAYRESDVISPDVRANTKFFKEWLEPMSLYYGAIFQLKSKEIEYMEFYLYRSREEGDFSNREIEILDHLSTLLSFQMKLQYPAGLSVTEIKKLPSDINASLTYREREILEKIINGTMRKDLADSLFISESTLNKHFANIYTKLGCHSYEELLKLIH